jgi:hypothetical protein
MTTNHTRPAWTEGEGLRGFLPHSLRSAGVRSAHTNGNGTTILVNGRRGRPDGSKHEKAKPGSRLIGTAAWLLVLALAGILIVSYTAQYVYVDAARAHQHVAAAIEAGIPDVLLIIFSLLAIGLARAGLGSVVERGAVLALGGLSALMNAAAADVASPRSVLAYIMPPLAMAFTVDRVASTYRRHVLSERDARSPWAVAGTFVIATVKASALAALYVLRFVLAPASTAKGVRRAVLVAAKLPELPAAEPPKQITLRPITSNNGSGRKRGPRGGKTVAFLAAVKAAYGEFAAIDLAKVAAIAKELAPGAQLHEGQARKVLRAQVLAALPVGGGDTTGEGDGK